MPAKNSSQDMAMPHAANCSNRWRTAINHCRAHPGEASARHVSDEPHAFEQPGVSHSGAQTNGDVERPSS